MTVWKYFQKKKCPQNNNNILSKVLQKFVSVFRKIKKLFKKLAGLGNEQGIFWFSIMFLDTLYRNILARIQSLDLLFLWRPQ
jgi:hypothetical protein